MTAAWCRRAGFRPDCAHHKKRIVLFAGLRCHIDCFRGWPGGAERPGKQCFGGGLVKDQAVRALGSRAWNTPQAAEYSRKIREMSQRFLAVWIAMFAAGSGTVAQAPETPEVRGHESGPSFRIRVETNLVTVTVVVRDKDGRPVGNLEKKDFRLFDSGKLQEITGFRVETAAPKPAAAEAPASKSGETITPVARPTPERFFALFFDDFHMPIEDVTRTRSAAWHYLSTAVRPEDRVGIFTSSAKEQVDFTTDRDKLHDALFRLAPHSRTIPFMNRCPSIDAYQAYLIDQLQDPTALGIATAEGYECHCVGEGNPTPDCRGAQMQQARADAGQIWSLADSQSQWTLEAIQLVVRHLAAMQIG